MGPIHPGRIAAALAAILFVYAGVAIAQPEGHVGIRLMEAPADRADDPRAQSFIIDHVAPGVSFSRRIEVVNTTDSTLDVELYPGAADITDAGWTPAPGSAENQLTEWIDVDPSRVSIPPGGGSTATVTVSIPESAGSGERYAVVWAQPPAGGQEVEVVNRVGIRVYLSVGEGREPPSSFEISNLTARRTDDGVPLVSAEVSNTGERALDLTGELTLLDGPAGLSAGPFATDGATTLAPDSTGEMGVLLDPELPAGPWLARMVARSGNLEKAVEGTITFPDGAGESAQPVAAEDVPLHQDRGFLVPLAGGLTLVTLIALGLFWFFFIRRRDPEEEAERRAAKRGIAQ